MVSGWLWTDSIKVTSIYTILVFTIWFASVIIVSEPIDNKRIFELKAFKPSAIECVYSDNGDALDAEIQYHVEDDIAKPEEKIFPAGSLQ